MKPDWIFLLVWLCLVSGCAPKSSAPPGEVAIPSEDASLADEADPPLAIAIGDDDDEGEDDAGLSSDASSPPPDARPPRQADAAPEGACARSLAPGDLTIDELMIVSVAGTGDHGEWLEVTSAADCTLNLAGLHGECASGIQVRAFDVSGDLWLPPKASFLIADSEDPAINHDLPGTVLVWSESPGDVLRNLGGTVTLRSRGALVDSITYPSLTRTIGASVAFPSDCPANARSDWSRWQTSKSSWFPGFLGTPGASNDDVHCP
jgi:hypothetical protein